VSKNEERAKLDAQVLVLLDSLLESSADKQLSPEQIEKIKDSLIGASTSIKRQAFIRAQQVRKNNWDKEDERDRIEKTIPIFEALLEDESERNSDKVYAELGYALKDQAHPDWERAAEALTQAIGVRGSWETEGNRMYEFNRAYCRIMLDKAFDRGGAASPEAREDIVSDLAIAASRKKLRKIVQDDTLINSA
jgi:hypothetical protein